MRDRQTDDTTDDLRERDDWMMLNEEKEGKEKVTIQGGKATVGERNGQLVDTTKQHNTKQIKKK